MNTLLNAEHRSLARHISHDDSPEKVFIEVNQSNDSPKIFYRYDGYHGNISLARFIPISETPCGYWILNKSDEYMIQMANHENIEDAGYYTKRIKEKRRWISKTSRRRYAYPTRELALNSFEIRKEHHIAQLKSQLRYAEDALKSVIDHKTEILDGKIPVYTYPDYSYQEDYF